MIGGYLFSARKFRNISRNDDGPEFRTKMKQNIEIIGSMLGQRFENKVGSIINLSINFIAVCNFDKLKGESRKPIKLFPSR